ncbi:erythromycin esterase family protein [Amycolatopsis sp. NPDC059657]|uniref:erythromycin esterase family protein n=1 Tax=Amycolatopsis sp. NPDC059657 TaxID=3346899 RepID=UPI00366BE62A
MTGRVFRDRREAGRVLAGLLARYRDRADVIVLALPRGGVPVAYEVASALRAPLDVFLVRKLGMPGRPELAMGALASGGVMVLNDDLVRGYDLTPEVIHRVAEAEGKELRRREQDYRGDRPALSLTGKVVIVVDDGLATGASMRASIEAIHQAGPAELVVAVPAAPRSTCDALALQADEVVCATAPSPFYAVGASYWDFDQTTDDEVLRLLHAAWHLRPLDPEPDTDEIAVLRTAMLPTRRGVPADDVLFDLVGDARFVLIGEASHGTHEFYAARARMTRRLIEEKGFRAVAVEADWPDAYRVNRYIRGHGDDPTAERALSGFQRFPAWMWRNAEVLDAVGWLRAHNDRVADERAKTGFYGLDLYSLHRSADEVIAFLERVDPTAAERARARYSCFDHHDADGHDYGLAAAFGAGETCERQAVEQLVELRRDALDYARRDGLAFEDDLFSAERNAQLVKAAEHYYRTMFSSRVSSWNLRDRHMADTLDALAEHLGRRDEQVKIVVWAHNSHLGDARAGEPGVRGELNLGQLVRERHPGECRSIGFTTYTGTVTAAADWNKPAERRHVQPALPGSVEELFHRTGGAEFMLRFDTEPEAAAVLRSAWLERAIGVVYRPLTERQSHYFRTRPSDQFDAVIHLDETRAVEPLERTVHWETGELPETYPSAV